MITPFILIYNVNGYTVFSFNISVIIITIVSKDIINKHRCTIIEVQYEAAHNDRIMRYFL